MKFVKIAAVASVAAMVAGGAFANSPALEDFSVKTEIEAVKTALADAYEAWDGDYNANATDVHAKLGGLLELIDNNGAIDDVTFGGVEVDPNTQAVSFGETTFTVIDNSGAISTASADLVGEVNEDFFGAKTNTGDAWGISQDPATKAWSVTGIDGGLASVKVGALATELNEVELAISAANSAGWTEGAVSDLNTKIGDAEADALSINAATVSFDASQGSVAGIDGTYLVRTADEATVTIVNPLNAADAVTGRSHYVDSAGVSIGGVSYDSYVAYAASATLTPAPAE